MPLHCSDAFLDLGLLADPSSEVVEFRPSDLTATHRLHRYDRGRMDGEDLLAAYIVGNAAHCDRLVDTTVLLCDKDAFESLCPFAVSFFYANRDSDGVTYVHLRELRFHVLFTEYFYKIHYFSFFQDERSYRKISAA